MMRPAWLNFCPVHHVGRRQARDVTTTRFLRTQRQRIRDDERQQKNLTANTSLVPSFCGLDDPAIDLSIQKINAAEKNWIGPLLVSAEGIGKNHDVMGVGFSHEFLNLIWPHSLVHRQFNLLQGSPFQCSVAFSGCFPFRHILFLFLLSSNAALPFFPGDSKPIPFCSGPRSVTACQQRRCNEEHTDSFYHPAPLSRACAVLHRYFPNVCGLDRMPFQLATPSGP